MINSAQIGDFFQKLANGLVFDSGRSVNTSFVIEPNSPKQPKEKIFYLADFGVGPPPLSGNTNSLRFV